MGMYVCNGTQHRTIANGKFASVGRCVLLSTSAIIFNVNFCHRFNAT